MIHIIAYRFIQRMVCKIKECIQFLFTFFLIHFLFQSNVSFAANTLSMNCQALLYTQPLFPKVDLSKAYSTEEAEELSKQMFGTFDWGQEQSTTAMKLNQQALSDLHEILGGSTTRIQQLSGFLRWIQVFGPSDSKQDALFKQVQMIKQNPQAGFLTSDIYRLLKAFEDTISSRPSPLDHAESTIFRELSDMKKIFPNFHLTNTLRPLSRLELMALWSRGVFPVGFLTQGHAFWDGHFQQGKLFSQHDLRHSLTFLLRFQRGLMIAQRTDHLNPTHILKWARLEHDILRDQVASLLTWSSAAQKELAIIALFEAWHEQYLIFTEYHAMPFGLEWSKASFIRLLENQKQDLQSGLGNPFEVLFVNEKNSVSQREVEMAADQLHKRRILKIQELGSQADFTTHR